MAKTAPPGASAPPTDPRTGLSASSGRVLRLRTSLGGPKWNLVPVRRGCFGAFDRPPWGVLPPSGTAQAVRNAMRHAMRSAVQHSTKHSTRHAHCVIADTWHGPCMHADAVRSVPQAAHGTVLASLSACNIQANRLRPHPWHAACRGSKYCAGADAPTALCSTALERPDSSTIPRAYAR